MQKFIKMPVVSLLLICMAVVLTLTVTMTGKFTPATRAGMVDDLKDICVILNTSVYDPYEINWKGIYDCFEHATGDRL